MGIEIMRLVFVIFTYSVFASSASLQKNLLPSVSMQETNSGDKGIRERTCSGVDVENCRSEIIRRSDIANGGGFGGMNGGGSSTGTGNNGGSGSPYTQGAGGTAVIPVYAAGSANNHHHSAGNCIRSRVIFPVLAATTLAFLAAHIVFG